ISTNPSPRSRLKLASNITSSHSPARLDSLPHNARIECTGLDRTGKKHRSCQLHTVFPEMDETVLPARNRALRYGSRKCRCYIHKRYSTIHVLLKYGRATAFVFPLLYFRSFSRPCRLRSSYHIL